MTSHNPNGPLHDYEGVWLVKKGNAIRVSAPTPLVDKAVELAEVANSEDALIDGMKTLFQPAGVTIGPAFHAYASKDMLSTVMSDTGVREVVDDELTALKNSTSSEDWDEGGFATSSARYFVLEVDGEVVAAANLTKWRAGFDDIGLLVDPRYRGNGYGLRLAGVVAAIAAKEHGVVRYRSRVSNSASVAIFKRLGFLTYCEQTAVRSPRPV